VKEALTALVTALADDELIIGHRHSEWTGFAPHIEEDVAFSSIAQDEIGHAAALYSILAELSGDDPDRMALGRDAGEYTHAVLCERDNSDWAYTLARHWVYDVADAVRLEALEKSSHVPLAALATKMRREERYHLLHADMWMGRVAGGPVDGRTRLIASLTEAVGQAAGLFEPAEHEAEAVYEGLLPLPFEELFDEFVTRSAQALDELGLPTDIHPRVDEGAEFVASSSGDLISSGKGDREARPSPSGLGGRRGSHSGAWKPLWEEMTETYRSAPGASW
jgi:ring-1,2-phenylacetyl-CoA epoxidase subunit PaaC